MQPNSVNIEVFHLGRGGRGDWTRCAIFGLLVEFAATYWLANYKRIGFSTAHHFWKYWKKKNLAYWYRMLKEDVEPNYLYNRKASCNMDAFAHTVWKSDIFRHPGNTCGAYSSLPGACHNQLQAEICWSYMPSWVVLMYSTVCKSAETIHIWGTRPYKQILLITVYRRCVFQIVIHFYRLLAVRCMHHMCLLGIEMQLCLKKKKKLQAKAPICVTISSKCVSAIFILIFIYITLVNVKLIIISC